MAGRRPRPDSYICNLNDITFSIACRQPPSQGTEIELVVPAIFSCPFEEVANMMFLLDNKIYSICGAVEGAFSELKSSIMRRNFHILEDFPGGERNSKYNSDTIELVGFGEKRYLTYYWRSLEETNSAFRR